MKMLELAVIDDGKQFYRDCAKKAIEGNEKEPKLSVPVQLYELTESVTEDGGVTTKAIPAPDKEAQAKLVNALRSGLSGAKEGVRFSVEHKGQIAWVSINESPARKRAVKKSPATPKPAAKAAGK